MCHVATCTGWFQHHSRYVDQLQGGVTTICHFLAKCGHSGITTILFAKMQPEWHYDKLPLFLCKDAAKVALRQFATFLGKGAAKVALRQLVVFL